MSNDFKSEQRQFEQQSELLSAYHDGEVTPMERAEVERLLADEVRAQREVDELRDLSTTLSSSGGESAPEGLYEAVMRRIERESLLPSPSVTPSERQESRPTSAAWVGIAAAVTTIAAGLLVAVGMMGNPADPPVVADTNRPAADEDDLLGDHRAVVAEMADKQNDVDAKRSTVARSADQLATAFNEHNGVGKGLESAAADSIATDGEEGRNRVASAKLPGGHVPSDPPRGSKVQDAELATAAKAATIVDAFDGIGLGPGRNARLTFDDDLKRAEVGDIVRALENTGDEVAVVRLTVVDRRQGLEALQLLLARNEIDRDSNDESDREAEKAKHSDDLGTGLEAVFVEATPDQLARTIAEMQSIASFRSLEVDEPIALAKLDGYTADGAAMGRTDELQQRADKPKDSSANDVPHTLAAKPGEGRPRPTSDEAPSGLGGVAAGGEPAAAPAPVASAEPADPSGPAALGVDRSFTKKAAQGGTGARTKPLNKEAGERPADLGDSASAGEELATIGAPRVEFRARQRSLVVPPALFARASGAKQDAAELVEDKLAELKRATPNPAEPTAEEPAELAEAERRPGLGFGSRAAIRDETARRKQMIRRPLPVVFVIVLADEPVPANPEAAPTAAEDSPEGA